MKGDKERAPAPASICHEYANRAFVCRRDGRGGGGTALATAAVKVEKKRRVAEGQVLDGGEAETRPTERLKTLGLHDESRRNGVPQGRRLVPVMMLVGIIRFFGLSVQILHHPSLLLCPRARHRTHCRSPWQSGFCWRNWFSKSLKEKQEIHTNFPN